MTAHHTDDAVSHPDGLLGRFRRLLASPVSGGSLAALRIAFGLVLAYESAYYLGWTPNNPSRTNLIESFYTGEHVAWNIYYPGFSWARPLPEPWMTLVFAAFGLAALAVAAGVLYRPAIITVFLTFAYINLMEACTYLNHFYLACLIAFLMSFMPADRVYSVRAWLTRGTGKRRRAPRREIPFWCVFLLRAQMFIVYFYAGLAKLNADWLVGEPPRTWLRQPTTASYLERFFSPQTMESLRTLLAHDVMVAVMTYGGMVFDLLIGFLLLSRRTRAMGFLLVLFFHSTNFCLFNIGAFPVLGIWLTTIFFEPDWPARLGRWLRAPRFRKPDWAWFAAGAVAVPVVGAALGWRVRPTPRGENKPFRIRRWTPILIGLWIAMHCTAPLRHYLIEGDPSWTEEGSMLAWHMMLRNKETGEFRIEIRDPFLPVKNSAAGPYVDWRTEANANERLPLYLHVNVTEVPWAELPQFVIVVQPLIGERVIYNPFSPEARGVTSFDAIRERWQQLYGRPPAQLWATKSLATVLEEHRKSVVQPPIQVPLEHVRAQDQGAQIAIQLDARLRDADFTAEEKHDAAHDLLQILEKMAEDAHFGKALMREMFKVEPLAEQGNHTENSPFVVVMDLHLVQRGRKNPLRVRINRQLWRGNPATLIDVRRYLPTQLAGFDRLMSFLNLGGQPTLLWNYASELHRVQAAYVSVSPTFLHRYIQHVADLWQNEYGRRPQVYTTCFVKLNHHPMQLIIDPRVDLASVPLHIFRHNEWILPLKRAETVSQTAEEASPQPDAAATSATAAPRDTPITSSN